MSSSTPPHVRALRWLAPKLLAHVPGGPPNLPAHAPLDPVMRGLLALDNRTPIGFDASRGPVHARARMRNFSALFGPYAPSLADVRDGDMQLSERSLPYRHYRPKTQSARRPTLVYFHGGGFVIGDIASYDNACRVLAASAEMDVVSVEYRLAPEHPFPAAHEDATEAFAWVEANVGQFGGDRDKILVGGDSAGGNLALAVSGARAGGDTPTPAAQLLIYPLVDCTRSCPSHQTLGSGYILDTEMLDFFSRNHLPEGTDHRDARLSPLLHPRGAMPPTLFILAGYDPLVDEGRRFSAAMSEDGVHVETVEHAGLIHGFVNLAGICDAAQDGLVDAGRRLRAMLDRVARSA